jgi:hypothetical protein
VVLRAAPSLPTTQRQLRRYGVSYSCYWQGLRRCERPCRGARNKSLVVKELTLRMSSAAFSALTRSLSSRRAQIQGVAGRRM